MSALYMNASTLFLMHTKKCSQKSSIQKCAHLAVVETRLYNSTFLGPWKCGIFDKTSASNIKLCLCLCICVLLHVFNTLFHFLNVLRQFCYLLQ